LQRETDRGKKAAKLKISKIINEKEEKKWGAGRD